MNKDFVRQMHVGIMGDKDENKKFEITFSPELAAIVEIFPRYDFYSGKFVGFVIIETVLITKTQETTFHDDDNPLSLKTKMVSNITPPTYRHEIIRKKYSSGDRVLLGVSKYIPDEDVYLWELETWDNDEDMDVYSFNIESVEKGEK